MSEEKKTPKKYRLEVEHESQTFWVVYIHGHIAAFLFSLKLNGFFWAVLHFFFGWAYLMYMLIFRFAEVLNIFK